MSAANNRLRASAALMLLGLSAAAPALAEPGAKADSVWPGRVQTRAELGVDARVFRDDHDPLTVDEGLALRGRYEFRHQHGTLEQRLRLSGRVDPLDSARNRINVEEALLQVRGERWRLRLGAELINWTATEAFHPADVVNARDLDSDLENFDKRGEPMALLQYNAPGGDVWQWMWMPYYTQTRFAPPSARLSFVPPGIDLNGRARRFDRHGEARSSAFGPQFALRWQRTFGSVDLSLHAIEHMDRLQPLAALSLADGLPVAVFQQARQIGGTWQQAFDSGWLVKIEAAHRSFVRPRDPVQAAAREGIAFAGPAFPDRRHTALAVGLEYTFAIEAGDSSLLLEAQSIAGVPRELARTLSPFQRDLLIGHRLGFARANSAELLSYVIVDLDDPGERLWNLSYQQRVAEHYTLALAARVFQAPRSAPAFGFAALRDADHLRISLTRHF